MSRIFYDAWNLFCFQVEKQLRLAYKAAEGNYKRSQSTQHQNAVNETIYREWLLTDDSTVQSLENRRLSDWYRIGTDTGCILSNRIGYCCIGRRYTRINAGSSTVDGIAYTHDDQRAFKRPVTRPPRTHACVLLYGPWYGRGLEGREAEGDCNLIPASPGHKDSAVLVLATITPHSPHQQEAITTVSCQSL